MATEVFIILILALVLVLVFYRRSGVGRVDGVSKQQRSTRPSPRSQADLIDPFDKTTSKAVEELTILTGKAFVVDGDTIKVQQTQVRLFGIDAPELNHPYGQKAKWELHKLCRGQMIKAEVTDTDDHGRTVARCFLADGRDLSAEMVRIGMAIDWPKFSGGCYSKLEVPGARRKLFLADARQKGRMHVWKRFEERQTAKKRTD